MTIPYLAGKFNRYLPQVKSEQMLKGFLRPAKIQATLNPPLQKIRTLFLWLK